MLPSVLDSLNSSLHQAFLDSDQVYLLGEDILDPYGGAFKVSRGLSSKFPDRVITTPISEAGIVGLAAGMALRGLHPVVEIMFGDFLTLIADQLINHITKFHWMYNNQVKIPMVIRTPMGGRRGYGPTHSQTLEKLYLGVPGLQLVAPAAFCKQDGSGSPGDLLYQSILKNNDPLLFIENKLQYLLHVEDNNALKDLSISYQQGPSSRDYPTYSLSLRGAPPPVLTIASYGYMSELTKQAALKLAFEHEIFTDLVIPTLLSPFEIDPIIQSVNRTGKLLTVEEGTLSLGWGAEVLARIVEYPGIKQVKCRRLAAMEVPVPSSGTLESQVLPGVDQIVQAVLQMIK
jgi:pyruvate/2-oxoglutarate/acetoin dehydrogenase E1 component